MSALRIPQISVVHGISVAGGAYVPAMSDQTIIVRNQGRIFLAGPPLVRAATGEEVDEETLGGGDMHARESGVVDYLVSSDEEGLQRARECIADLGGKPLVEEVASLIKSHFKLLTVVPPSFLATSSARCTALPGT